MEVLVFKTNLSNTKKVHAVRATLDVHPDIYQWNVDIQDCDKVLRVITTGVAGNDVVAMINSAGYFCEELF